MVSALDLAIGGQTITPPVEPAALLKGGKGCLLGRRLVLKAGGEFFDCGAQFRLNLATFFEIRCIAEFGVQFFDMLFDRHLILLDVCER